MTYHRWKDAISVSFRNCLGILAYQACYHLTVIWLVLYMVLDGSVMFSIKFFPARAFMIQYVFAHMKYEVSNRGKNSAVYSLAGKVQGTVLPA